MYGWWLLITLREGHKKNSSEQIGVPNRRIKSNRQKWLDRKNNPSRRIPSRIDIPIYISLFERVISITMTIIVTLYLNIFELTLN